MRDAEKFKNLVARELGALLCPVLIWTSWSGLKSILGVAIVWVLAFMILYGNLTLFVTGEIKLIAYSVFLWLVLVIFFSGILLKTARDEGDAATARRCSAVFWPSIIISFALIAAVQSDPKFSGYIRYLWLVGLALNLTAGVLLVLAVCGNSAGLVDIVKGKKS